MAQQSLKIALIASVMASELSNANALTLRIKKCDDHSDSHNSAQAPTYFGLMGALLDNFRKQAGEITREHIAYTTDRVKEEVAAKLERLNNMTPLDIETHDGRFGTEVFLEEKKLSEGPKYMTPLQQIIHNSSNNSEMVERLSDLVQKKASESPFLQARGRSLRGVVNAVTKPDALRARAVLDDEPTIMEDAEEFNVLRELYNASPDTADDLLKKVLNPKDLAAIQEDLKLNKNPYDFPTEKPAAFHEIVHHYLVKQNLRKQISYLAKGARGVLGVMDAYSNTKEAVTNAVKDALITSVINTVNNEDTDLESGYPREQEDKTDRSMYMTPSDWNKIIESMSAALNKPVQLDHSVNADAPVAVGLKTSKDENLADELISIAEKVMKPDILRANAVLDTDPTLTQDLVDLENELQLFEELPDFHVEVSDLLENERLRKLLSPVARVARAAIAGMNITSNAKEEANHAVGQATWDMKEALKSIFKKRGPEFDHGVQEWFQKHESNYIYVIETGTAAINAARNAKNFLDEYALAAAKSGDEKIANFIITHGPKLEKLLVGAAETAIAVYKKVKDASELSHGTVAHEEAEAVSGMPVYLPASSLDSNEESAIATDSALFEFFRALPRPTGPKLHRPTLPTLPTVPQFRKPLGQPVAAYAPAEKTVSAKDSANPN